jgi:UDPglucose 6-dehydrogenase
MTAGMGDAGPCHPRDNIALRYMAENLSLGYDLFGSIMISREKQADNLASLLYELHIDRGLPVYIHGKAYKPGVDMVDGSYSLLIGHYLEQQGLTPKYIDPLTEGEVPTSVKGIVLLAHNAGVTYDYVGEHSKLREQKLYCEVEEGSVIVDPWRTYKADSDIQVIHYGNTRLK